MAGRSPRRSPRLALFGFWRFIRVSSTGRPSLHHEGFAGRRLGNISALSAAKGNPRSTLRSIEVVVSRGTGASLGVPRVARERELDSRERSGGYRKDFCASARERPPRGRCLHRDRRSPDRVTGQRMQHRALESRVWKLFPRAPSEWSVRDGVEAGGQRSVDRRGAYWRAWPASTLCLHRLHGESCEGVRALPQVMESVV